MARGRKPDQSQVKCEIKGVSCTNGNWRVRYYIDSVQKEVKIGKNLLVLLDETTQGMSLQSVLNDFAEKIDRLNQARKLWGKTNRYVLQEDLISFVDRLRLYHVDIYNSLLKKGLLILGSTKETVDRMLTVKELIDRFYENENFIPATKKTYRIAFAIFDAEIREKPVALLTKKEFEDVVKNLKTTYARGTAEKRYGQIKTLLSYAAKIKLLPRDSELFDVELVYTGEEKAAAKRKESPKKNISVETFTQIVKGLKQKKKSDKLSTLQKLQYEGIFTFIRFFGLRVISELRGMKWEHIHGDMITIYTLQRQ